MNYLLIDNSATYYKGKTVFSVTFQRCSAVFPLGLVEIGYQIAVTDDLAMMPLFDRAASVKI